MEQFIRRIWIIVRSILLSTIHSINCWLTCKHLTRALTSKPSLLKLAQQIETEPVIKMPAGFSSSLVEVSPPAGSNNATALIKPIDQGTIDFMSAGEKISDIETVVRELVENSIDAQAKNVEVRLTRFGVDCIEVEDNGIGIPEADFPTLGQRYHTSKISNFQTLQECLDTFGFRGEAISCLCRMATVTILTKTKDSPTGNKLMFQTNGIMMNAEKIARADGTTVIVKNLFQTMPVRRRELEVSAKRQYDKVVKLLYEQVLARPHIKFALYKKSSNKKILDFVHGGSSLEVCIATMFGTKTCESLIPIKHYGLPQSTTQTIDIETKSDINKPEAGKSSSDQDMNAEKLSSKIKMEKSLTPERSNSFFNRARKSKFKRERPVYSIHGYISKIGCGRSTNDCQFNYVNSKPCDLPRVTRVINDVYRSHSNNQYPFYILFVEVQKWAADHNVPRKRAVILQDENQLVTLLKESIEEMFSSCTPAVKRSCNSVSIPVFISDQSKASIIKELGKCSDNPRETSKENENIRVFSESIISPQIVHQPPTNDVESMSTKVPKDIARPNDTIIDTNEPVSSELKDCLLVSPTMNKESDTVLEDLRVPLQPPIIADDLPIPFQEPIIPEDLPTPFQEPIIPEDLPTPFREPITPEGISRSMPDPVKPVDMKVSVLLDHQYIERGIETDKEFEFYQEFRKVNKRLQVDVQNIDDLSDALNRERYQRQIDTDSKEYLYAIHPKFNNVAEQELKVNLNKQSFGKMQIMGQFNKGFIIAKLSRHLFIIDQHATDERANYEDELKKCPLMRQTMVCPKPLYLNTIQENVVINNYQVFKDKGFEFLIDENKMAGFRVLMTGTSICKGQTNDVHLTKEDIEELIDVISNSPNHLSNYVLEKVRHIAASRACRKSVMIGETLNWAQMDEIVYKMADLENPWICAHNRPTIRHLMHIDWKFGF